MTSSTFAQLNPKNLARITEVTLYLSIPESYRREPIITQLVSQYQLQVNILAATLGNNRGHGQFKLTLIGNVQAINDALAYLEELQITVLLDQVPDGW